MSVITKGKTFANGEQLTAGKLNQMLDSAVFGSGATDNTKIALSGGRLTIAPGAITLSEVSSSLLTNIYPVGSVYINASVATNPGTLLGFGTWVEFAEGEVPVGRKSSDPDFDVVGSGTNTNSTTGDKEVTLTINQIPQHNHLNTASPGASSRTVWHDSQSGYGSNRVSHFGSGSSFAGRSTMGELVVNNGGGGSHNNLQPYIVVYMWKRTA